MSFLTNGLIVSTDNQYMSNSDAVTAMQQQQPHSFQILNNDTSNLIVEMTSLYDLDYDDRLEVAYEPQENGTFTSNSKQGTPYKLVVTGISTPMLDTSEKTISNQRILIANTISALDSLRNSLAIVKIITTYKTFTNLTFAGYNYWMNSQRTVLFATMFFQEARVANVQFQALPANQVANPTNASQINNGQVQPNDSTNTASGASSFYGINGTIQ